jgi:hypothetical protein
MTMVFRTKRCRAEGTPLVVLANAQHLLSSSPGLAVRRTASLSLAYDRAIQYSRDADKESRGRSVLDTPQEPVIGIAEGETRWRGLTDLREACLSGKSRGQSILPSSIPAKNISLHRLVEAVL